MFEKRMVESWFASFYKFACGTLTHICWMFVI